MSNFLAPYRKMWIYKYPVDMRKQIDGLCALISERMGMDPQCGDIFIFFGFRTHRVKLLFWDGTGFVLIYKRLEGGSFAVPRFMGKDIRITRSQLVELLKGITNEDALPHKISK